MPLQPNIPIGLPGTIATPPAGQVTEFFDTTYSPPKLSYKDELGAVYAWPLASATDTADTVNEIAEEMLREMSKGLREGTIKMSDFQTFVNSGSIISGATTDDGHGNTTNSVTIAAANIPATALAMVSAPFTLAAAVQAPVIVSKTPANATSAILWTSSNTSRITVNQSGIVTGVGVGAATITASIPLLGLSATLVVTGV